MTRPAAVVALLVGALSACGYHFGSARRTFAPDAHTIRIGPFKSPASEVELAHALARALEAEFRMRGRLRVVGPGSEADLVLTGSLRTAPSRPVAFTATDEALLYETGLVVDLSLRRAETDEVLWRVVGWRSAGTFSATADTVVTTSPSFRVGNLDVEDLSRLTEIHLSESQRRVALGRLVEAAAVELYNRMTEDF